MNSKDFILNYWKNYILIEKEFMESINFIEIDEINYKTYSSFYAKLLLQIGSEIDIVFKKYCKMKDNTFNGRSIDRYRKYIIKKEHPFINEYSMIINTNIKRYPWKAFGNDKSPNWWEIYNGVKHRRTDIITIKNTKMEAYKFANLETILDALCGLYQLLIYMYYEIASRENQRILTPLPGSKIFKMNGNLGKQLHFYGNMAFYVKEDTGELIQQNGYFTY